VLIIFAEVTVRPNTQNIAINQRPMWPLLVHLAVAMLLITRQIYYVATVRSERAQEKEELWYPLAAVPELVTAALLCIPEVSSDIQRLDTSLS
jgi:hypothetical protein